MRLNHKILLSCLLAWLSLPLSASAQGPLHVVASFSILGDLVQQVAGDHVILNTLVGPGGDAHVYEPTPSDAKLIAHADLVIVNGLGFEGWLDRLIAASGYSGPVIIASSGVVPLKLGTAPDPHAWQDLGNGQIYVRNIRDALVKADPANAEFYRTRAASYLQQLQALDGWVREELSGLNPTQRRAITPHDALRYFAHAYGVTFIAPLGISTAEDVSAGNLARLIDQIRGSHIRALFMENMTDPRLVKELVSDGGAVIGGTLYSDALSPPGGEAPTYVEMFHHNVMAMRRAMQGNQP